MTPVVVKCGDTLIPLHRIDHIDISEITHHRVTIYTLPFKDRHGCIQNKCYYAEGFDAIEAVMLLKPSALEGKRMRWQRNAWAYHNLVAHPVVQILAWLGFKKAAIAYHDWTTPRPR